MTRASGDYVRKVEPIARDWRSQAWSNGVFDTGRRGYTERVEGVIRTPQHVLMVTLRGGADRVEVTSDCGHRHSGPDRTGLVSFVPAHCGRSLALTGVEARWGSIALDPILFEDGEGAFDPGAFTNVEDPFAAAMVSEFGRLHARDGRLDATYCESMSWALARHLTQRYGGAPRKSDRRSWKIAPWRLRRIVDHIEAKLDGVIRVTELAEIASLSPGYFHRAFRATTGQTPLAFINTRRIERATELIRTGDESLAAIALTVGFVSPRHFTRTFRQVTGANPSSYRIRA